MSAAIFRGSPLAKRVTSAVSSATRSPLGKLGLLHSINLYDESIQNTQESRDKTSFYGQMKKWITQSEQLATHTVTQTTVSTSEMRSADTSPQTGGSSQSSINIRPVFTAAQKKQQDKLERNLHKDFEDDHHNGGQGRHHAQDVDTNGRVTRSRARTTAVAENTSGGSQSTDAVITTQYTTSSTVMSIDENGQRNDNNLAKTRTRYKKHFKNLI
jgi:hypothetical protein